MTASIRAVFFDLYGTLLDLRPLSDTCEVVAPGRGEQFARTWRAEQLRSTWLRTVMGAWADFEIVTAEALSWTARSMAIDPDHASGVLGGAFDRLPVRVEARPVLEALRAAGLPLGILSNGSARMLALAVAGGGLADLFEQVISVDEVERYKPHPAVYGLAVTASGHEPSSLGFVSANDWDAAGAAWFGFRVAWLRPEGSADPPSLGGPAPVAAAWADLPGLFAP